MKKNYFLVLILCFQFSFSQYGNVSTLAGDGSQGYSGDGGPATSAVTNLPSDVVIDNDGNIYFTEITNCVVRKIATNGTISTVAGIVGNCSFSGDGGQATSAKLDFPTGLAVDSNGNLFIADRNNDRIRKVDINGVISTFAGTGTSGFSGDGGQATAANLNSTSGICADTNGNIYFSDRGNDRIRKIDTNGIITTVAGKGGFNAFSGDGGQATDAELNDPNGIDVDADGNIYVVDRDNHRIRKITTDGIINTIVGTGNTGSFGGGFNGDGQAGTATMIKKPTGIAIDNDGSVIFADYNNQRIRKLVWSALSLDNFSLEDTKLFPNPISVNEQLTIKSKEIIKDISIYNTLGQEVYKVKLNSNYNVLNLDQLTSGIYLVRLNNLNNTPLNYKLIKN